MLRFRSRLLERDRKQEFYRNSDMRLTAVSPTLVPIFFILFHHTLLQTHPLHCAPRSSQPFLASPSPTHPLSFHFRVQALKPSATAPATRAHNAHSQYVPVDASPACILSTQHDCGCCSVGGGKAGSKGWCWSRSLSGSGTSPLTSSCPLPFPDCSCVAVTVPLLFGC